MNSMNTETVSRCPHCGRRMEESSDPRLQFRCTYQDCKSVSASKPEHGPTTGLGNGAWGGAEPHSNEFAEAWPGTPDPN